MWIYHIYIINIIIIFSFYNNLFITDTIYWFVKFNVFITIITYNKFMCRIFFFRNFIVGCIISLFFFLEDIFEEVDELSLFLYTQLWEEHWDSEEWSDNWSINCWISFSKRCLYYLCWIVAFFAIICLTKVIISLIHCCWLGVFRCSSKNL